MRMIKRGRFLSALWKALCSCFLTAVIASSSASQQAPLLYDDFEKGQGLWFVIGTGKASIAKGDARSGQFALSFTYQKGLAIVLSPIAPMPEAKSVSLWVKPSHSTALLLVLQENDGSRYGAAFYVVAKRWQLVQLSIDEMFLMPDTKDENDRLDMAQVSMIGLADALMLFQVAGEEERTVLIDDLLISALDVKKRTSIVEADGEKLQIIDDFENPTLFWAPLLASIGKMELNTTADISVEFGKARYGDGSLSLRYELQPNTIPLFMTLITGKVDKAIANSFTISVNATAPTGLVISLIERDGSRYQTFAYVHPDGWHDIKVSLNDFFLADDSKDENERLDVDQVQAIAIADAGGFFAELIPTLRGKREIRIDRVAFSSAVLPQSQGISDEREGVVIWLDNFEASVLRWVPIEVTAQPGFTIDIAKDTKPMLQEHPPGEAQGRLHMSVDYDVPANGAFGVVHIVTLGRNPILKHAGSLRFFVKVKEKTTLLIALQERGGGRYEKQINLKGGEWQRIDLPFTDFILSPDTKDEDQRLDPDEVFLIGFADISALDIGAGERNSLSIDGVCFLTPLK
ncbi:MAG: hypothetical protein HZRFUVUK_001086 [Candidatus Fervidibacterota bacterium]